jgi:hypothetical protein
MIYITTFILALFLPQIASAQSQTCDAVSPEVSTPDEQHIFPPIPITVTDVTYSNKYDNPKGLLKDTACSSMSPHYKFFGDIPSFPLIGGTSDILFDPTNCGTCWNLTNTANNKFIYLTAMDSAKVGFIISEEAYKELNRGKLLPPLSITAARVPPSYCLRR